MFSRPTATLSGRFRQSSIREPYRGLGETGRRLLPRGFEDMPDALSRSHRSHLATVLLPSFLQYSDDADDAQMSRPHHAHLGKAERTSHTSFLDGMRGLAAFCVYVEHFALPFRHHLYHPYSSWNDSSFFQLPIIRLFYSGSPMVCIFFVISGIALSLEPAALAERREWLELYRYLESAVFRRGIRLYGPSLIASLVIVLGTYFRLLDPRSYVDYSGAAEVLESFWEQQATPLAFRDQLREWVGFVTAEILLPNTWRGTSSIDDFTDFRYHEYGSQLWTISVEYWSSILLYVALVATARIGSPIKLSIFAWLAFLSMCMRRWDLALFMYGSVVAQSRVFRIAKVTQPLLQELLWAVIFCIGLFVASYPEIDGKRTLGYVSLSNMSDRPRLWQSIGAAMIGTAAGNVPFFSKIFSSQLLSYLGRISFSLYLVHLPFLEAVGWRLVPLMWQITGKRSNLQDNSGLVLSFLLILPIVIYIADLYYKLVDKACNSCARRLEIWLKEPVASSSN